MKDLKEYIFEYKGAAMHNSRKSIGDPDGITYDFKEGQLNIDWDPMYISSYPFIYNKKDNKILFGYSGSTHNEMFTEYSGTDEWEEAGLSCLEDTHQLRYIGSIYDTNFKEEISEWYAENKQILKTLCSGRIWYIDKLEWHLERWDENYIEDHPEEFKGLRSVKEFKDTYAIIAFWNDITPSKFKEYCDNIIKIFNSEKNQGKKIKKYIAVGNNGEPLDMDITKPAQVNTRKRTASREREIDQAWKYHADNTEAGRKKKREIMKGYIKSRDEHFQKEYYNKTKSKTAAEWHNNKTKRYNPITGKMEWGEKIGDSLCNYNSSENIIKEYENN